MKKNWESPVAVVEGYTANEAVAACGDTEEVQVDFLCDAGNAAIGYNNVVYFYYTSDNRLADTVTSNTYKATSNYMPCGATTKENIAAADIGLGWIEKNGNGKYDAGVDQQCLVWLPGFRRRSSCSPGMTFDNVHCSTDFNIFKEVAKS